MIIYLTPRSVDKLIPHIGTLPGHLGTQPLLDRRVWSGLEDKGCLQIANFSDAASKTRHLLHDWVKGYFLEADEGWWYSGVACKVTCKVTWRMENAPCALWSKLNRRDLENRKIFKYSHTLDKPARLIIRLSFGFVSDSAFVSNFVKFNKIAKLGDAIAISNLKLSITDWPTDWQG